MNPCRSPSAPPRCDSASLELAETVGVHAVEVDAIDVQAKTFYEKYGFVSLLDQERHLAIP